MSHNNNESIKRHDSMAHQLITRLKWKTMMDEFLEMENISIANFTFEFDEPLTKEQQMDSLTFIDSLDLTFVNSINIIGLYFVCKNIGFKLKYKYNIHYSLKANYAYRKQAKLFNRNFKITKQYINEDANNSICILNEIQETIKETHT